MKNNPAYIALKQAALDGNYTVQQVKNATAQQIAAAAGVTKADLPYLPNVKQLLIRELNDRDDEINLQSLRSQIWSWLQTHFPNFALSRGKKAGKKYITIWLDGKPDEEI